MSMTSAAARFTPNAKRERLLLHCGHPDYREKIMDIDTAMQGKGEGAVLATDLLRADHETVRQLFDAYQDALDSDASSRQSIAQEICMQLELHSRVELEVFYPAIHDEDSDFVDTAVDEHEGLASTIAEIRVLPASSNEYDDHIFALMDLFEEHVTEEEEVLFPELEARIPTTLVSLTDDIIHFKERVVGSTEDLEGRPT